MCSGMDRASIMVMDLENDTSSLDALDREAHAWVRRLVSGEATHDEAEALRLWCARSSAHAGAFAEASRLWQAFGPAAQRMSELSLAPVERRFKPDRMTRRAVIGGAIAASAVGWMIVRPPLELWPSLSELQADYRTGPGESRRIVTSGGVSIEMNTRTSIALGAGHQENGVELISGEASIRLPTGNTNPFEVLAAGRRLIATGAHFDVRILGREACVTCAADVVEIEDGDRIEKLRSGQQITYGESSLGPIVTVDASVVTSWQEGVLIFRMTPLQDVINELNRYRPGRILLLNSDLAHSPVNGRFRSDRLDDALGQIELAFKLKPKALPGGILLLT
jgi:transmembrane sensor